MFADVWKWGGKFRTFDVDLGITWQGIESGLEVLLQNLPAWEEGGMDVIEQAARLHHRAVQIHPFPNGNGRWYRMLANVWLKLHRPTYTEWPEGNIGTQSLIRNQYLNALRSADNGDIGSLVELHRRYLGKEDLPPGKVVMDRSRRGRHRGR
jgi:fido (protein-threonine AMPylation protein)